MTGKFLVARTEATLPGVPVLGIAAFEWAEEEAMEVTMTVTLGMNKPITWHFSRDLLDQAFSLPEKFFGEGDVKVKQAGLDRLHFYLASDNGQRRSIFTKAKPVMDMVIESFGLVPPEEETTAVDDAIAKLLGESA